MTDWVQRATEAYKQQRDKEAEEQRLQDRQDAIKLATMVGELIGERVDIPTDGLRLTVSHGEHPLTFAFLSNKPQARGVVAVVQVCPACHQEVKFPIATLSQIGKLIVEGPDAHNCTASD